MESGGAATLSMAAGTATATQLNVAGTLDVADGAHTTLDISGGFAGGGVLVIDVNFADGSGDKIDVAGDITGVTRIQVKSSGRNIPRQLRLRRGGGHVGAGSVYRRKAATPWVTTAPRRRTPS